MTKTFKTILMCVGSFGAGAVSGITGYKFYEKRKLKKYSGRYKWDDCDLEDDWEPTEPDPDEPDQNSNIEEKIKDFQEYVNRASEKPLEPVPEEDIPEGVVISNIPDGERPRQVELSEVDVDMCDLLCFTQFKCGTVTDENFEPVDYIEAYIPADILEVNKTEDDVFYTYSPMFNAYVELTYDSMLYEDFLKAHPMLTR